MHDGSTSRHLGDFDLAVVGGGTAGVATAAAAAMHGLSVVLVEAAGCLGGMATSGAVGTFCGLFTSGPERRPIPARFGHELVRDLADRGDAMRLQIRNTDVVPYDLWALQRLLDERLVALGIRLRLHTVLTGVEREPDGALRGLWVHGVEGQGFIGARQYVDASGDAALVALAGAPTDAPARGTAQAATLVFRMANVDTDAMRDVSREEVTRWIQEAARSGAYDLPRSACYFYPTTNPDEANCNMTAVHGFDFADSGDLTAAEIEGRHQAAEYARFLVDRIPGFERSYLSFHGAVLGVRESRRIEGRYRIEAEDVTGARSFPDGMAYAAWPIELHGPDGAQWRWQREDAWLEVPHRALLPIGIDNVQAVGRCISATPEAHASTRVMGTGMSMGEGAAVAAALALADGCDVADVDPVALRAAIAAFLDDRAGVIPDSVRALSA